MVFVECTQNHPPLTKQPLSLNRLFIISQNRPFLFILQCLQLLLKLLLLPHPHHNLLVFQLTITLVTVVRVGGAYVLSGY